MQYTIEARELTNANNHGPASQGRPLCTLIEADDVEEAISQFVVDSASELVNVIRPARGSESIATVKKDEAVYLVRVYAA